MFRSAVLYSALAGLLYQAVCGTAAVFQLSDFYLWLRFYPFPVSGFWYSVHTAGCLAAMVGILFVIQVKKGGIVFYFAGKFLMLVFLIYALTEKFLTSHAEPYIETYLAGIGVWLIYPVLILLLLKTQNQTLYDKSAN